MKKSLVFMLLLSFVLMFSIGVLAEEHEDGLDFEPYCDWLFEDYWEDYDYMGRYGVVGVEDDGTQVSASYGEEYTNLPLNRDGIFYDENKARKGQTDDDQEIIIRVPAFAYIPCYLEMTLTGNELQNVGKSFGPQTAAYWDGIDNYPLIFDNEMGGFVDEDWNFISSGMNAEIEQGTEEDPVFIAGCDIFCVKIDSNEEYKYEVWSKPLEAVSGEGTLNIFMITSLDQGENWGDEFEFVDNAGEYTIKEFNDNYLGENIFLHNFKVPYNDGTHHGEYEGDVLFRVVSI